MRSKAKLPLRVISEGYTAAGVHVKCLQLTALLENIGMCLVRAILEDHMDV